MRYASRTRVRADLRPWPYDPTTLQVVLLDLMATPSTADVEAWVVRARRAGAERLRTSALFPNAAATFLAVGFGEIDRLALLELELGETPPGRRRPPAMRTRALRRRDLAAAAELDRRAFGDPWALDARAIADISHATPESRARLVRAAPGRRPPEAIAAYAVSGRAGSTGYLQRLAVDPAHQGAGLGRALVDDALGWMAERTTARVLVNTGVANTRALALYDSSGFARRSEDLVIAEIGLR